MKTLFLFIFVALVAISTAFVVGDSFWPLELEDDDTGSCECTKICICKGKTSDGDKVEFDISYDETERGGKTDVSIVIRINDKEIEKRFHAEDDICVEKYCFKIVVKTEKNDQPFKGCIKEVKPNKKDLMCFEIPLDNDDRKDSRLELDFQPF